MKITVYATGYSANNGKPTQKGGSAVVLKAEDEFSRKSSRTMSHPVGNCTTPCSEINGARLALASIRRKHRKESSVHLVVPKYVYNLLVKEDDEFKSQPKKNVKEIGELRRWSSYFNKLRVTIGTKAELMNAFDVAKQCADNQRGIDTGTKVMV